MLKSIQPFVLYTPVCWELFDVSNPKSNLFWRAIKQSLMIGNHFLVDSSPSASSYMSVWFMSAASAPCSLSFLPCKSYQTSHCSKSPHYQLIVLSSQLYPGCCRTCRAIHQSLPAGLSENQRPRDTATVIICKRRGGHSELSNLSKCPLKFFPVKKNPKHLAAEVPLKWWSRNEMSYLL